MINSERSDRLPPADVAVIGGGPAGLSAALWAARYRRRVVLVDGGRPRNAPTAQAHGYLALDGTEPLAFLRQARRDLRSYPEVTIFAGTRAVDVAMRERGFDVVLDDGRSFRALRLILATGVVDVLPDIERFGEFYGSCVFTCPTCDGYEAQDKAVAVIGDDEHLSAFAIGMLDWASAVTLVAEPGSAARTDDLADLRSAGIDVVVGKPVALTGPPGKLEGIALSDGSVVSCEVLFCTVGQTAHSDLAHQLGCDISGEGCVVVDDDGQTSLRHVFAAGDMTPGPQLVQIAAAKGARAGIAAALSLRGEPGVRHSPHPAPEPDSVLGG
jgi:thioredoxin reductase